MRQRLIDFFLVAAATVDLHFIIHRQLFYIRVLRDVSVGREVVVYGHSFWMSAPG